MPRRFRFFFILSLAVLLGLNCGKGLRRDTGSAPGENPVDDSDDSNDTSNNEPITLTSVSPSSGGRGTTLTIVGTGFTSDTVVTVGGVDCGQMSVTSSTELSCEVGAHRPGTVTVEVQNPGSTSQTLTNAYTYKSYLFLAEQSGEKVTGYSIASSGALTLIDSASTGSGSNPTWLALDPRGKFVFTIQGGVTSDKDIRSIPINPQNGSLGTPVNKDPNTYTPGGIAVHPSGNYLVVTGNPEAGSEAFYSYSINRSTGVLTLVGTVEASDATQVVPSPDGNHFYGINSHGTNGLSGKTFSSSGQFSGISGDPFSATTATTLAISPNGNCVVVAIDTNFRVLPFKRTASSGSLNIGSTINMSQSGGNKRLLAHPTLSLFYVLSAGPDFGESYRYDPSTCALSITGTSFPNLSGSGPRDFAFDSTGEFLYVSHFATDSLGVFSVDGNGNVSSGPSINSLSGPMGVVVD